MANVGFKRYFDQKFWHIQKETFFVEKILTGLYGSRKDVPKKYLDDDRIQPEYIGTVKPKIHTIRKVSDHIKVGSKMHLCIGNRTPERFVFAPIQECKAKEKINFFWTDNGRGLRRCKILIGNHELSETYINGGVIVSLGEDVKELIENDGFSKPILFFEWFHDSGEYEIQHWTNKVYSEDFTSSSEEE